MKLKAMQKLCFCHYDLFCLAIRFAQESLETLPLQSDYPNLIFMENLATIKDETCCTLLVVETTLGYYYGINIEEQNCGVAQEKLG